MTKSKRPKPLYNCDRCPAYCCTYPRICVTPADIRRLARHFGLAEAEAARRFTKPGHEAGEVVLRHRADKHFGTACRFLDQETRRCTIYTARPGACRAFPGTRRCGYYDFLSFERRAQEDPDYISVTNNR